MRSIAALALVLATGCGTLFNEDMRMISVSSNPPGGTVYVDGEQRGQTPLMTPVSNHKPHVISVQGPGGATQTCQLDTSVGALWVILDLFGLVPLIVDAVTGEWSSLTTSACFFQLGGPPGAPAPGQGWGAPPGGG